eukprot:m.58912 g.58912  ORF g.58912 m.58912 type:complete len:207 (-) comp12909_c0_seq2:314-934(-)
MGDATCNVEWDEETLNTPGCLGWELVQHVAGADDSDPDDVQFVTPRRITFRKTSNYNTTLRIGSAEDGVNFGTLTWRLHMHQTSTSGIRIGIVDNEFSDWKCSGFAIGNKLHGYGLLSGMNRYDARQGSEKGDCGPIPRIAFRADTVIDLHLDCDVHKLWARYDNGTWFLLAQNLPQATYWPAVTFYANTLDVEVLGVIGGGLPPK